jgi:APA family basic amino acid/polyamine antiporter
VYGRARLGPFWGYLAGWAFVVGKTASCAAMALTFASYAWPAHVRLAAAVGVIVLTVLGAGGVQKSAWATWLIVTVVLAVLALVVVGCFAGGHADHLRLGAGTSLHGVLQSAGLLFFAFAGYARIATLGEEVRDPARTIPRAISLALGVTVAVYAIVAVAALSVLGASGVGGSAAPLRAAVEAGRLASIGPVVRVGGAVAALGSLLALLLGVSRTTFAMARDRYLPGVLDAIHPRHAVPYRAELAVGAVVVVLVLTTDLRGAIGFSSFGVLGYYGIANASAATLGVGEGRPPRWLPPLGLLGCAVLAFSLPVASVVAGTAVLVVGALAYGLTRSGARR